jgi:hypothetical protein
MEAITAKAAIKSDSVYSDWSQEEKKEAPQQQEDLDDDLPAGFYDNPKQEISLEID